MTEEELVALALGMPETAESRQIDRRDFTVRGKTFLTLRGDYCVLSLTPEQQELVVAILPEMTQAVQGGWGERGLTRLYHALANAATVQALVKQAWKNAAPKLMILRRK